MVLFAYMPAKQSKRKPFQAMSQIDTALSGLDRFFENDTKLLVSSDLELLQLFGLREISSNYSAYMRAG